MGITQRLQTPNSGVREEHSLNIHNLHMDISHERSESAGNFLNDNEEIGYLIFAFKGKI